MPPAVGAILAGVAAALSPTGIGILGVTLTGWTAGLAVAAASFAMSAIQGAFSKPKTPNLQGFKAKAQGQTQQIKQAITPRRIVYGEARVSGPLLFVSATGAKNKYLHLVIALAGHEVEEIGEIWFNETSIPPDAIDGSGNVTAGPYAGKARIKKHLGTDAQTADTDLVGETEAESTDRFQGIAYLYIRLEYDRNVYPSGIPNVSAWVKGRKIYDPRDAQTRYSPNAMLMARDYLTDARYGIGAASADVDADTAEAGANICDEIVDTVEVAISATSIDPTGNMITIGGDLCPYQTGDRIHLATSGSFPGGLDDVEECYWISYQRAGTVRGKLAATLADSLSGVAIDITSAGSGTLTLRKTGEPRYHGGGVIETDAETGANFRDLLSAMGGEAFNTGGVWILKPAAYEAPTITLTQDDLRAPLRVQTKVTRAERFNAVKGIYVSPLNSGQPSDYPAVTNSTYETADGGEPIFDELDLPQTQRPAAAQRLAKIKLERHRQEIVIEAPCSLTTLRLKAGDTVNLTYARMGWTNKVFEVRRWSLVYDTQGDVPVPGADLVLQETASAAYDWNSGEETAVDPAPNTEFPNPFTVTVPVGFSLDSIPVLTLSGDKTYKIRASWNLHEDAFVREKGHFEFRSRLVGETEWKYFPPVDGSATTTDLFQAELDVVYDAIEIRALNNIGVPSQWVSIEDFVVGTSAITDSEDWESETLSSEDWESDSLSSEDWES